MRIILIGPPGSGKGTQSLWLSEHYHIPSISTGNILRTLITEQSPVGQTIAQIINQGQLVPDDMIIQLLQTRFLAPDCQKGFILDGFPRTLFQAKQLNKLIPIDLVIAFSLSDQIILERFSGRRIHPSSGRVYHIKYRPPTVDNQDDITGEPLIKRSDDAESIIKKRLEIYHQETQPIQAYYRQLSTHQSEKVPLYYSLSCDDTIENIQTKLSQVIMNYV